MNKLEGTKKILHLSPTDIRFDGRILKELEALSNIKDTSLFAFGVEDNEGRGHHVQDRPFIKTFSLLTKRFRVLPRPIRYFVNLIEAICRLTIPAVRYRPSVIHCHDTLYLPIALLVKFFCRSKLVYDAHELESDKVGQSKILAKYTLLIERIAWKHIDLLICVSKSIESWYQSNLGYKESILVLNAPKIDETADCIDKSLYLRNKFDIPAEKKVYIYVGILGESGRSIPLYLNTFSRNDIESHVVFLGYGSRATEVAQYAAKFKNIHYHESVPFHEVVNIVKSADVGLCIIENLSLSTYYCLPNKLFEYAFSGVYILASDFPDMKHVITEHKLGQCCSLNPDEFYEKVKSLENIELKFEGINLIDLSWETQANKLLKAYQQLLNNR